MTWEEANRDALVAELALVRTWLRAARPLRRPGKEGRPTAARGGSGGQAVGRGGSGERSEVRDAETVLAEARARLERSSALDDVAQGFGLTDFERSLLLLTAGPEIAAGTADELTAAGADQVTFGLALSVLPGAHWGALTPRAPLRRWRLVHLLNPTSPTHSPLVADERVLHHLLGAGYLDPDLAAVARPVPPQPALPPTLSLAADAVGAGWEGGGLIALTGPQRANVLPVAEAAAARIGHGLLLVDAADLPGSPTDREQLLRLMERESVLSGCAWAIDASRATEPATALRAVREIDAPTVVLVDEDGAVPGDTAVLVRVPRVPVGERRNALAEHVGSGNGVDAAAAAFDLPLPDLYAAAHEASKGRPLWDACRERASSRFDGLALVLQPRATWEHLVLPELQLEQLHALVAAVRHRGTVLDDWGFARRSSRGLGTAALFSGASGTGKTLAAEVIATSLGLDLVVVDLSQVVSKYIGETEKNLRRVFEAAEDSGAVLLFDEADTLFGKRTEIRDSHDRYANLEVGYLLQRIESFRGLAILTTNAKSVLDQAFLRRLRFIVGFPYPDPAARERMWRLAFPPGTPTSGLDPARLAATDLSGGGIAAAALTAAYLGASHGEVTPDDVAAATRWEMAKTGRSVTGR